MWKLFWGMNCPHKIKLFMWRACLNILPTKNQLRRRGIGCDGNSEVCGCCETTGYALWGCKVVEEVWRNTRLKLPFFEITPRDFIDVVWETKLKKPEIDWELFAITAWSLWCNRNSVCHGGKCKAADLIVREVSAYAKECRQKNEIQTRPERPAVQHWTPPSRGCYKVNVDGAVFKDLGCCGVGVVIRNEAGQIMGAMSKRVELPLKALETEAKAVEEGICLARDLNLSDICVESDAQVVIKAFSAKSPVSSIQKVIEGIKMDLSSFDSWEVKHVCRTKNSATYIMAQYAKVVTDCCIWVEDNPPVIENQLLYDVAHLSITSV